MARYQKQRDVFPIGTVSHGTMREEDLIPDFTSELAYRLKHGPKVDRATRKAHFALLAEVARNSEAEDYYESEESSWDLESLFDALGCYAGPYMYFGAHPGDGSDYGYWLSESWDEDFSEVETSDYDRDSLMNMDGTFPSIKVPDLECVPAWFRGEVAVCNDHGNVTLYVKTSRTLREIWSIV